MLEKFREQHQLLSHTKNWTPTVRHAHMIGLLYGLVIGLVAGIAIGFSISAVLG